MMKRLLFLSLFAVALALPSTKVSAQFTNTPTADGGSGCSTSFLGLPTWYRYLQLNSACDVVGPTSEVATGQDDDPNTTMNESVKEQFDWERASGYIAIAIVEILLRLASLVAVGFVIYGGFRYITSQGEPENAKSARQTIINALIGLVIAIAAASIVAFIGNRLGTPS